MILTATFRVPDSAFDALRTLIAAIEHQIALQAPIEFDIRSRDEQVQSDDGNGEGAGTEAEGDDLDAGEQHRSVAGGSGQDPEQQEQRGADIGAAGSVLGR